MTISLNGEVVHSCDTATDFQTENSGANISGDDAAVEGAGAVGDKMSNTTEVLAVDAFEGATTTFDFSVGGTHEGWHGIGYVNTKTPINATTGIQAYVRNTAGHNGYINAMPSYFYNGGFTTRVWNPTADFTAASTWTTTGNPAQLDDVTGFGFRFTTITSIMGSFNNTQVDQFTFGLGVRADVGTAVAPNTYQAMVDQDQDTSLWGWLSSFGAKGGIYIGPATGTTASWFVDSAFAIKFLDENVAAGFYGLFIRGANTTCELDLANISAENPANARWSLILDSAMGSVTGGFVDTNGVYSGFDTIALNQYAEMTGTTCIDGEIFTQNTAILTGLKHLNPARAATEVYMTVDDISKVTGNFFQSGGNGYAVDLGNFAANTSITWNNTESGYVTGSSGTGVDDKTPTGNETILVDVDSGFTLTINIAAGASTPSVANAGLGSVDVVVGQNTFDFTLNPSITGYEWRLYVDSGVTGEIGTTELDGEETATLDNQTYTYTYTVDTDIVVQIIAANYEEFLFYGTLSNTNQSFTFNLTPEDNL